MKPFFWVFLLCVVSLVALEDKLSTRVVKRVIHPCFPDWLVMVGAKKSSTESQLFIREVFANNREGVIVFNRYILGQLKEKPFFELVDNVLQDETLNDREIYESLFGQIHKAKYSKFVQAHYELQALKTLKRDLAWQVAELVGKKPCVGYAEMGYTGGLVKSLKRSLSLSGIVYVLNDKEPLFDYFESGSNAHNTFIPLNDYAPIAENDIPSESLDLFVCYNGFHHIPQEKIKPFVASIFRTLRSGGIFILREHDAATEDLRAMAHVVHSITNLATLVTPAENEREIRNFHALDYWIHLLKDQGFEYHTKQPLVRTGDSSVNSLIRFDKPMQSHLFSPSFFNDLKQYLQVTGKTEGPLKNSSLPNKIHFPPYSIPIKKD